MTEILPHNNPILLGHEEQEKVFLDAYLSDKLHHAWIIHGVEGIGKTTLAYKIARFLISDISSFNPTLVEGSKVAKQSFGGGLNFDILSEENIDPTPHQNSDRVLTPPQGGSKCSSLDVPESNSTFKLIAASACPDLLLVEREFDPKKEKYKKEIVVGDTRKINKFMHKTSSHGNYRVVIVDEADKMNRNSQNAILKILEEPPKKTVIILTANNIGSFLPTIKSRCRSLKLDSISDENISILLTKFCPKITEEENKKISLLCEGSIGKAMQIYNNDGLLVYEDLIALLSKNIDTKELHKFCEQYGIAKNDKKYQLLIMMFKNFLNQKIISLAKKQPMINIIGMEDIILDDVPVNLLIEKKAVIEKLISDAEISNLDRRKILLYIFSSLLYS